MISFHIVHYRFWIVHIYLPCEFYHHRPKYQWHFYDKYQISYNDIQHYHIARYPTDDWHLANIFSLVHLSVVVCLRGLYHYSGTCSSWPGICVAPPHRPPPPRVNTKCKGLGDIQLPIYAGLGGVVCTISMPCGCYHCDGFWVSWILFPIIVCSLWCVS